MGIIYVKGLTVFLEDSQYSVNVIIVDLGLFHALDKGAGSFWSPLPHAIQVSPAQAPEFTNRLYQRPARFQPQGWGNEWGSWWSGVVWDGFW